MNDIYPPRSPLSFLLPYQAKWVADQSRFKIRVKARQIGGSTECAAEGVRDCLRRKTTWTVLSVGERSALETMAKVKEWSECFKVPLANYDEERENSNALLTAARITWPNGSRFIGIPAKPATVRGSSTNVIFDEFAHHEDSRAVWAAMFPSISNELRCKYLVRVTSTPNGQGNKFHELVTKPSAWSKHRCDIHQAIADGLPVNLDLLRENMDDPEMWAQEYECEFLDTASILLGYDLINACESADCSEGVDQGFWIGTQFPTVCGIDFGRSKNLTVCWTLELQGKLAVTKEVLCLRGLSSTDQEEILLPRIKRASRACLDYSSVGIHVGDVAGKRFGLYDPKADRFGKVECNQFTNSLTNELYPKLKAAMEGRRIRIPASREIREDLHSMQRVITPSGNVSYRAFQGDDGSHADRCVALALAVRAMESIDKPTIEPFRWGSVGQRSAERKERSVA